MVFACAGLSVCACLQASLCSHLCMTGCVWVGTEYICPRHKKKKGLRSGPVLDWALLGVRHDGGPCQSHLCPVSRVKYLDPVGTRGWVRSRGCGITVHLWAQQGQWGRGFMDAEVWPQKMLMEKKEPVERPRH